VHKVILDNEFKLLKSSQFTASWCNQFAAMFCGGLRESQMKEMDGQKQGLEEWESSPDTQ
jgi:hypothetical protein